MFNFQRLVDNCTKVGNEAAQRTLDAGRPVASWDAKRRQAILVYPDGKIEDIPKTKNEG